MVQSSSLAIGPQQFVGMTRACSLNRLAVYATFLSSLIRAAKQDETVKVALQSLRDIFHTGVALNKEDGEWASANGLKVIVRPVGVSPIKTPTDLLRLKNSYSTTETGPLLRASSGPDSSSHLLRPLAGSHAVFLPNTNSEDSSDGPQLYELAVPSGVDECPPAEFCGADGYYHTKDLFERVDDGWVYRGRAGDWIKVVSGFCDTKCALNHVIMSRLITVEFLDRNMEDIVRKACPELVHDVVVVGSGRAFPCLIVESAVDGLAGEKPHAVAEEIVKRTAELSKSLYAHERIQDPLRVLVVEKGTLPRTRASAIISVSEDDNHDIMRHRRREISGMFPSISLTDRYSSPFALDLGEAPQKICSRSSSMTSTRLRERAKRLHATLYHQKYSRRIIYIQNI